MLYHASSAKGLSILEPHISTHKKAYVYAIKNAVTAVIFGARHDDFDFIINEEDGIPVVYECYPCAFQDVYRDKDCSLYEVNNEGFLSGMTTWEPEYVCESSVTVVNETVITDIYSYLLECENKGKLTIHLYEQTKNYRSMVSKHIVDRLIRFDIDLHNCLQWKDTRFAMHYKSLIISLTKILDGEYLG